jgi:hypothetical protein
VPAVGLTRHNKINGDDVMRSKTTKISKSDSYPNQKLPRVIAKFNAVIGSVYSFVCLRNLICGGDIK